MELWSSLGDLQCNWTVSTDLDEYINRAARERGITLPATSGADIRIIPVLSEIYALEHLYNNAINKVDVNMGGKTVELTQIADHLKAKLTRLYNLLGDLEETDAAISGPIISKTVMVYEPAPDPQKVDVRRSTRYTGTSRDVTEINE